MDCILDTRGCLVPQWNRVDLYGFKAAAPPPFGFFCRKLCVFGISLHWGICKNDAERKGPPPARLITVCLGCPLLVGFQGKKWSLTDVSTTTPQPQTLLYKHAASINPLKKPAQVSAWCFRSNHSCHLRTYVCDGTRSYHLKKKNKQTTKERPLPFSLGGIQDSWCSVREAPQSNNSCSRTCTGQETAQTTVIQFTVMQ